MKANVLGTEYEIITDIELAEDPILEESDGYIDYTTKEIKIAEMTPVENSVKDIETYKKGVIRHELIHAFFYESGMAEWTSDEDLVEWLALQFPKMNKAFEELELL